MEVRQLADDIHVNGLQHAVVYDPSTDTVIDGLIRIEAFKALGRARIPAVDSTFFPDIVEALLLSRPGPLTQSRVIEIVTDLLPVRAEFIANRRKYQGKPGGSPWPLMREMFADALGIPPGRVEVIIRLILRSAGGDELANDVLGRARDNTMTVYSAEAVLNRRDKRLALEQREPMPEGEAVAMAGNAVRTLKNIARQLEKMGGVMSLPPRERQDLILALRAHKREIHQVIKTIGEGMGR